MGAQNYYYEHGVSEETLSVARDLVVRYLAYLRHRPSGSFICDETELPAKREILVHAFRVLIANEMRVRTRRQLVTVGLTLAQFQTGLGDRLTLEAVESETDDGDDDHTDTSNARDAIERIDRALRAVAPDRVRLGRLYRDASQFGEIRSAREPINPVPPGAIYGEYYENGPRH